ncbi:OLC1v1011976C1 [Oldenlandia corymbosa var. corymbosa]|nr:OLC1v1011976C1 [Oldenlandia corymbosa var. corymbosa]
MEAEKSSILSSPSSEGKTATVDERDSDGISTSFSSSKEMESAKSDDDDDDEPDDYESSADGQLSIYPCSLEKDPVILELYREEQKWIPKGQLYKDEKAWAVYFGEIHRTRGYEVKSFPGVCLKASFWPWDFRAGSNQVGQFPPQCTPTLQDFIDWCGECIDHFNKTHPQYEYAFKGEAADIERVTVELTDSHDMWYLTFKASNVKEGSNVKETFRAKYCWCQVHGRVRPKRVAFCELKMVLDIEWEEEDKANTRCYLPCCLEKNMLGLLHRSS